MANFRNLSPSRTCLKLYANYGAYKPYLAEDFNHRCGYTDCPDFWFGGPRTFHIDHFKPFSKYPHLKTTYSNLVYCCSYVNIRKSDDDGDYLDPCEVDFNDHFERTVDGSIIPKAHSPKAKYMYEKLQLYLQRYRLIWKLEEMFSATTKLIEAINACVDMEIVDRLRIAHSELAEEKHKYEQYLRCNQ